MTPCRGDWLDLTISCTHKIPEFIGLFLRLGGVSQPAVRPLFSLNRPVYLRLRFPLPALRSPPTLLPCTHPCLNDRAGPGLRRARRQHRASQMGFTGQWLLLLRRDTPSLTQAALTSVLALGLVLASAAPSERCSVAFSGSTVHRRQHRASQVRPDFGAYMLVAADPPSGRFYRLLRFPQVCGVPPTSFLLDSTEARVVPGSVSGYSFRALAELRFKHLLWLVS
ncbi:hypothetical protein NDU88_002703 [Pleurodeles waltl]|uniref:Uncharacterized protein n=1 Tax=Pleurodeles waltl TaxID=8319 RepID=A0AAV7SEC7_PLEWA|nr:hypothetical protein NDU88_002703 [Pleurodeles waltl]